MAMTCYGLWLILSYQVLLYAASSADMYFRERSLDKETERGQAWCRDSNCLGHCI